jgi:predicted nucleic acid-binding protein
VRIVVADTTPIYYLVLIGHAEILPALFEKVSIPLVVRDEMTRPLTPAVVREWIQSPPAWLELHPTVNHRPFDKALEKLDDGEREALVLAESLRADLLLLDDRQGMQVAREKGFRTIGTLRVLHLAALRGLLNLSDAFDRIKNTNFRYRREIMDHLLNESAPPL